MSEVIPDSSGRRPAKRMRAKAKAASAETTVEMTTEPTASRMLLRNQRKKRPPRSAVPKLSITSGLGKPNLSSE